MKFEKVVLESLESTKERRGDKDKLSNLVSDFRASRFNMALVTNEGEYHNNNDMRHSLKQHLRKCKINDIDCFMLNGKVYLTKVK